jgi:general secretion pathway protein G
MNGKRIEMQRARATRSAGFTLIEIMAVVLIIGFLTSMVGIQIFRQVDKARVQAAQTQIGQLESLLELYRMDNARFPTTEQGLEALIRPSTLDPQPRNFPPGGYLNKPELPLDPWQNAYQYTSPGECNPQSFDLWSFGADGKQGGDDLDADIGNCAEANAETARAGA